MRIRTTTGLRFGFSTSNHAGQPVTIISGHYPGKHKHHKTKEELERDSRVDKTHRG